MKTDENLNGAQRRCMERKLKESTKEVMMQDLMEKFRLLMDESWAQKGVSSPWKKRWLRFLPGSRMRTSIRASNPP